MRNVLLCALCVFLSACGDSRSGAKNEQGYAFNDRAAVTEFRLKDGTRCVKSYNGGITCDWEENR